jgi:hypothetical protein
MLRVMGEMFLVLVKKTVKLLKPRKAGHKFLTGNTSGML